MIQHDIMISVLPIRTSVENVMLSLRYTVMSRLTARKNVFRRSIDPILHPPTMDAVTTTTPLRA